MNKNALKPGLNLAFCLPVMDPGVAGQTGVPPRYAATPSQTRNPTLAETKCSDLACTHLLGCLQEACQILSWLLKDCRTTVKIQIHGQGKRKREEESKQARRIYIISSLLFIIPTSSPRVPVNSLGTGGFDLCSPCCYKQHILSNTGLVCEIPSSTSGGPLGIFAHYSELFLYFFFLGRTHQPSQNVVKYLPSVSRLCQVRLCIFSLSGGWHVPCLVLLPFQRTVTMALIQGQRCRMKQHCNTGGNKCLKAGLQLYIRVKAWALPMQQSEHANTRGRGAVW